MFAFAKILAILCLTALAANAKKQWWETASFYQIYPRSFKDSDGDGVGDLRGISEKLTYLKEIGITATWLSPIFTSPMADFGYDIANFTEIDPIFGTMDDFEALLVKAKVLGIKIIVDFVPNHSSDECNWFQRSANNDTEYKDFYVWHQGKIVNGVRQAPTNWISSFRGSQWTWNDNRHAYYLHQYAAKQPDLNYRNPAVLEKMKNILRFWLKKGVDGFRVDAVNRFFEAMPDADGNYLDEPRNSGNTDPLDYGYLKHIYTRDQPENVDLIYRFRQVLDEHKELYGGEDRILMAEVYSPIEVIMQYFGNATTAGSQIPINFELMKKLNKKSDAHDYAKVINHWLSYIPTGRTSNWLMGSHDQKRLATRIGRDRNDMINLLLLSLPGCSITYMGEEIGMTDVWISWNDTVDPKACQSNPDIYEKKSRDPCRTPFQWNDQNQAGFTNGNKTWLPVSDNYKSVNVERERNIPMSHLNVYKQMQSLRQKNTFRNGDVLVKAVNQNVLAVQRFLPGDYTFILLMNLMDDVESLNLNIVFSGLTTDLEYVIVTDRSTKSKGDKVCAEIILLKPKESVVLRTLTKV